MKKEIGPFEEKKHNDKISKDNGNVFIQLYKLKEYVDKQQKVIFYVCKS
jgi:hypothetical protein